MLTSDLSCFVASLSFPILSGRDTEIGYAKVYPVLGVLNSYDDGQVYGVSRHQLQTMIQATKLGSLN